MATTATKSIAARLPFDEYVRVLNQATEAKLTVSDYLILKLSASDRVAQAEAQQAVLTQQVKQLKQEAQKLANLAHNQQINHKREMIQLQKQADTNQQTALEKQRVQLKKVTKKASEWQTHANNLLQAKTVLEQTIETHEQTLAQQQDKLTQLKAKNGLLTSENQKLQRESSVVKTELAALKQQGISLWDRLAAVHDDHLFGKLPDRYWVILNEFKESLEARP